MLLTCVAFARGRRLKKDMEHFTNLSRNQTDRKCAELIAEDGIHILINLNGHTAGTCRKHAELVCAFALRMCGAHREPLGNVCPRKTSSCPPPFLLPSAFDSGLQRDLSKRIHRMYVPTKKLRQIVCEQETGTASAPCVPRPCSLCTWRTPAPWEQTTSTTTVKHVSPCYVPYTLSRDL